MISCSGFFHVKSSIRDSLITKNPHYLQNQTKLTYKFCHSNTEIEPTGGTTNAKVECIMRHRICTDSFIWMKKQCEKPATENGGFAGAAHRM